MNIVLLANHRVGLEVIKYLVKRREHIVFLGVHDPSQQVLSKEIIKASGLPKNRIFLASRLQNPDFIARLKKNNPDILIAAFWAHILKQPVLDIFPKGCINFHYGYLPYNRGKNGNVWPFIDGTPLGISLHYMSAAVDAGDMIARKEIPIAPTDTAGSMYEKILTSFPIFFQEHWTQIKKGKNNRVPQKGLGRGTFHLGNEVDRLDHINLNDTYTGRQIINRLRARSYPNRYFAYYNDKGKRVYIRVQLSDLPT